MDIENARRVLGKYEGTLAQIVHGAWYDWKKKAPELLSEPYKRTTRQVVYNLMAERAKSAFAIEDGVRIIEEHESVLLCLEDLAFRFKKLDGALRPSNYPTPRQMELGMQLPLPGVPDCERLIVGYVPDELEQDISVHVVYVRGEQVVWDYSLERPAEVETIPLVVGVSSDEDVEWTFKPKRDVVDGQGQVGSTE